MENKSGIVPVEFKVLILPDQVNEKTEGGIFLPDTAKDREQYKVTKATVIACGGNAFEDWSGIIPTTGSRVYIAVNTGYMVDGADGQKYKLINDKDITGVMIQE